MWYKCIYLSFECQSDCVFCFFWCDTLSSNYFDVIMFKAVDNLTDQFLGTIFFLKNGIKITVSEKSHHIKNLLIVKFCYNNENKQNL